MKNVTRFLQSLAEPQRSKVSACLKRIARARRTNATQLDLAAMQLNSDDLRLLLPFIMKIPRLETLDLSHNRFILLLESIGELSKLKKLYLGHNQLIDVPERIGDLKDLEFLDLTNNPNLYRLPKTMVGLRQSLDILMDMDRFSMETFLELGFHFQYFASRRASWAQDPTLPGLSDSQRARIKPALTKIEAAKSERATRLDLGGMQLKSKDVRLLMPFILEIPDLERLDLSNNDLSTLPKAIGRLTSLQDLDLSGNNLNVIPDSIGALKYLKRLDLSDNILFAIPDGISDLEDLEMLNITQNIPLRNLSNRLIRLPETLDLRADFSGFSYETFFAVGFHFNTFESQRTSWASHATLPGLAEPQQSRVRSALTKIEETSRSGGKDLDLRAMRLTIDDLRLLMPFILKLQDLETLSLRNNALTTLPETIGHLSSLQKLDLAHNELSEIPECIGILKRLEQLGLRGNSLSQLPESIGNLAALQLLDLKNNAALRTLPKSMIRLSPELQLLGDLDNFSNETFMALGPHFDAFEARRVAWALQSTTLPGLIEPRRSRIRIALRKIEETKHSNSGILNLNSMRLIPEDLRLLMPFILGISELNTLSLRNNGLTKLPETMGHLSSLKKLDLGYNELTEIPDSLMELTGLEKLGLSGNALTKIPDNLTNLTHLKSLSLKGNLLIKIPDDIGKMKRLEELYLEGCGLTEIPDSIGTLALLKKLALSDNKLSEIPASIGGLTRLKELYLRRNQLAAIPDSIGELRSLEMLNIENNAGMHVLPKSMTALSPALDLRGDLGTLSSDTFMHLGFHFNAFSPYRAEWSSNPTLPWILEPQQSRVKAALNQITLVKQLDERKLSLRAMELTSEDMRLLMPFIQEIVDLETLILRENRLTTWPTGISNLSSLLRLDLAFNHLSEVPDDIGDLQRLEKLSLRGNALKSIPGGIGRLKNLEVLSLRDNLLSKIPMHVKGLKRLQALYLSSCKFTEMPKCIGTLKSLEILDLTNNQLTTISDYIQRLSKLRQLCLGQNALQLLPDVVGFLSALKILDIEDNPALKTLPNTMSQLSPALDLHGDLEGFSQDTFISLGFHFNVFASRRAMWAQEGTLPGLSEPQRSRVLASLTKIEAAKRANATELELCSMELTSDDLRILMFFIQEISSLKTLKLNDNKLSSLPESLCLLSELKNLYLEKNEITKIPYRIGALQQLGILDLSSNPLTTIPDSIGDLMQLQELYLVDAKLSEIPVNIGSLLHLEVLGLSGNQLSSIPFSIGALPNLKILDLANNPELRNLPASMKRLSSKLVFRLDLDGLSAHTSGQLLDRFGDFPSMITSWPNATLLSKFSDQQQPRINRILRKLEVLYQRQEQSSGASRVTQALEKIASAREANTKTVDLNSMELTSDNLELLMYYIVGIGDLETLNLRQNQLTHLPRLTTNLSGLKKLDLSDNKELILEDHIGDFWGLKELYLNGCGLTQIPDRIGGLSQLEILDLGGNEFQELPAAIINLNQLKSFMLNRGRLTEIPESIGNLSGLETLDLGNNELSEIPDSIGNLANLKVLDLINNSDLHTLPDTITRLSTALDIKVELDLSVSSMALLIDHFNVFAFQRLTALQDNQGRINTALKKIYPERDSAELWNQLIQMDFGSFQPDGADEVLFSTYKVCKEFLEKFPSRDPLTFSVYSQAAAQSLGLVLDLGVSVAEKRDTLQQMATAMGNCSTPIKHFLTQVFVGSWSGHDREDIPDEVSNLMKAMAVAHAVQSQLNHLLNGVEPVEKVAALLHCLFLRNTNEYYRCPIRIAGLEAYPNLPPFSENILFGFSQLDSDLLQRFAKMCCKTDDQGQLLQQDGKYQADAAKMNAIIDDFFAKQGILSKRERLVDDYSQALKDELKCYPDLVDLHYENPEVAEVINLLHQRQTFREALQKIPDADIHKLLQETLSNIKKKIKQLNDQFNQECDLSALTAVSGQLTSVKQSETIPGKTGTAANSKHLTTTVATPLESQRSRDSEASEDDATNLSPTNPQRRRSPSFG